MAASGKWLTTTNEKWAILDWITDKIAVGNYLEALDVDLLQREKFASAAEPGREHCTARIRRITVCNESRSCNSRTPPGNEPRLYRLAVDSLEELVRESSPVLVQCHAGRSRSAVVVAGYLVRAEGMEPQDALRHVAAKRQIAVTAGVERLLDTL